MKKSIVLAILGIAAGVTASQGQGTVNFSNYFSSTAPTVNYAATGVPAGKANLQLGGSFAAELAWFDGTTASSAALSLVPGSITYFSFNGPLQNSTADGDYYNSGRTYGNGAGWFTGPGTLQLGNSLNGTGPAAAPAGTVVTLQVFAFNNGSLAASTINGHSGLFNVTLGGGIIAPGTLAGAGGFTVASVPEPTTMALGGLGLAALLVARRKKA